MITDCHTHWGIDWEQATPGDPRRWLEVLDRNGVGRAVLFPHYGIVRPDLCAEDNDRVARLAARFPKRLAPVASAWPQLGKAGVAEARRALTKLGMRGLKFHPWLQGFTCADPYLGEMCALAGEHKAPVFFHDGTPVYSLPEQVAGLARRYPQTRFVLGHSGLHWHWRSAIQCARHTNLWLCLCGPHMAAVEALCRRASPDRLVWGSDFGFGTTDRMEYFLSQFRAIGLPRQLQERILETNPAALLGSD